MTASQRERPVSCRGCQQPTFDPDALCTTCRKGTQIITCDCKVCQGRSAKVVGSGRYSPTMTHNLVCIAHSPLAKSGSGKRFGPWPV